MFHNPNRARVDYMRIGVLLLSEFGVKGERGALLFGGTK